MTTSSTSTLAGSNHTRIDRLCLPSCAGGGGRFIEQARAWGLAVPDTRLVASEGSVYGGAEDTFNVLDGSTVLKPVYSRFATQTIIRPTRVSQVRARVSVSV